MEHDFKLEDRVVIIHDYQRSGCRSLISKFGTVRKCNSSSVGIELDEYVGGHDLHGLCKNGYGWHMPYYCVQHVPECDHESLFIGGKRNA